MQISYSSKKVRQELLKCKDGDLLNIEKINRLPHPLAAVMIGSGMNLMIENVCVETGLVRLDVCGRIDIDNFCMIRTIIDGEMNEHNPDDFYLE